MNSKIRLNKISIVETSFPTRITSKGSDFSINSTSQNKQVKINIEETSQLCTPIDHDCNYFLAKGILPAEIERCQVGRVTSLSQVNENSKFIAQFEGKVSYQVKNGKMSRLPLSAYLSITNPPIVNNSRYWKSPIWQYANPYPSSLSYFFTNALGILNSLQGLRPEVRIYPIQNFPNIYNVSVLGDVINLNTNLGLNLTPKLYKIGDDFDGTNFRLYDGVTQISQIVWNSSGWTQNVTGFLITLVNNPSPSPSETLLFYSKTTNSSRLSEIPILIGTPSVTLNIPIISYRDGG